MAWVGYQRILEIYANGNSGPKTGIGSGLEKCPVHANKRNLFKSENEKP
jgi:hypothetical protein